MCLCVRACGKTRFHCTPQTFGIYINYLYDYIHLVMTDGVVLHSDSRGRVYLNREAGIHPAPTLITSYVTTRTDLNVSDSSSNPYRTRNLRELKNKPALNPERNGR